CRPSSWATMCTRPPPEPMAQRSGTTPATLPCVRPSTPGGRPCRPAAPPRRRPPTSTARRPSGTPTSSADPGPTQPDPAGLRGAPRPPPDPFIQEPGLREPRLTTLPSRTLLKMAGPVRAEVSMSAWETADRLLVTVLRHRWKTQTRALTSLLGSPGNAVGDARHEVTPVLEA